MHVMTLMALLINNLAFLLWIITGLQKTQTGQICTIKSINVYVKLDTNSHSIIKARGKEQIA